MEDSFSRDGRGVGSGSNTSEGSGSNASDREQWGADEASLAHPLLTSCCVALFLTGRGPVPVLGLGVGDPCSRSVHVAANGISSFFFMAG